METLRFIRRARDLGLHLDDIGDILATRRGDRRPCRAVNRMIDERIADIDAAVAELERLRTALVAAKSADTGDDSARICAIIEHGGS